MTMPARELIDGDTPLRLSIAAELAFPDGSMTESGLKREYDRGRLACERICGRLYTTLDDVKQMRALCRENQKGSGNISGNGLAARPFGSSSTDRTKSAQAAGLTIAQGLIARSSATSQQNTGQTGEKVIPLR